MRPDYEEARAALAMRLGSRSLAHAEAVAATAGELAERFGVDVEAARLAGLLHDWCKDTPAEELLFEARVRDIEITDVDRMRPYLLHGPVGAALLADRYPDLDAEIRRAVEIHTFGAATMTDLDRILYVADMIEPGRDYRGVDKLRAASCVETLPELLLLAYRRSVTHVIRARRPLHPRTLEVWNSLVADKAVSP